MIRITGLSLPLDYTGADLRRAAARALRCDEARITSLALVRRSVDARKKDAVRFSVTADASLSGGEKKMLARRDAKLSPVPDRTYRMPTAAPFAQRPVIVGFGPAGMFAGLLLARAGQRPIIVERGEPVEQRRETVRRFWSGGALDPDSNVQFGEGGAGTFSDGKLNTGTKDERIFFVLRTFAEHGAPEEILFDAKPHIGTDRLPAVVRSIREEILALGGEIRFETKLRDILVRGGAVYGAVLEHKGRTETVETDRLLLAVGHSARDTFEMLLGKGCVPLEPKPFSVGARIEHLANEIDRAQYGAFAGHPRLGAADYRLAVHLPNGHGVYTFCMCPGGTVTGASSEPGGIVTNGMSAFARDGQNSNAALLVDVRPEDFGGDGPLAGVAFQRGIERAAYALTESYRAPAQRVEDFLAARPGKTFGSVAPTYLPGVSPGDLRAVLPAYVAESMAEGIRLMGRRLAGFDAPDALLTGPETRSSSPVRILRDERFQSPGLRGLYPCGEGAGYAGGITSAAVDGIRCAEAMLREP